LAARCRSALDAVVAACRAGATGGDVRRAWAATGEAMPTVPLVHGVGLGMEPPVIDAAVGEDALLEAGSVLSVTSWVAVEGIGGFLERDLVVVGEGVPEVLSRFGRGPGGLSI
jgi:Xaa-Pro dipeptidase